MSKKNVKKKIIIIMKIYKVDINNLIKKINLIKMFYLQKYNTTIVIWSHKLISPNNLFFHKK